MYLSDSESGIKERLRLTLSCIGQQSQQQSNDLVESSQPSASSAKFRVATKSFKERNSCFYGRLSLKYKHLQMADFGGCGSEHLAQSAGKDFTVT